MKKLLLIPFLFWSCAGFNLSDNVNTNASAYLAGRVSYIGAAEVADKITTVQNRKEMFLDLEEKYSEFLNNTVGTETIPTDQSVLLFNELLFVMVKYVDDPHALLSDLSYILQLYGAEFVDGKMESIQPVPRSVYVSFDIGWHVSKRMKNG